jgi:outer membrane protein assembly factor BamB
MHRISFVVLVLVLVLLAALPARFAVAQDAGTPAAAAEETANDWPMYRGDPGRTGTLPGAGPQGDPVLLWQFQAGGSASRSPAIAGGVVYIGSDDSILYALDAMTGAEVWRYDAGEAAEITPTVAGGMAYLNTIGGALIAIDAATGEETWRFAEPIAADSTPAVVDGLLYAANEAGNLFAIDPATGEERWRYAAAAEFSRSPAVADGRVFVGTSDGRAYGVDAASGAELWEFVGDEPGNIVGTMTAADGVVYAGQTATLYALDAATGEVRWRNAETEGFRPMTVGGGRLYGSGLENTVYALDATNGTVLWSFPTNGLIQASPAVVDGVVYVASYDRNLYALDAASGEERWRFALDGEMNFGPSVAHGVVYASTTAGTVYAIGGSESSPGGAMVSATPTSPDAATPAAMAAESLELLWQSTGGPDHPFYAAGSIAFDPDGNVWVMDAGNNRFQIFSPDGEFLEAWDGAKGGGERFGFAKPNGGFDGDITFDAAGNIYVSESGARRVRVFDPERRLIAEWGEHGTGPGQFVEPLGIAVDSEGNVYVVDLQRHDIQKFDGQGNLLAAISTDAFDAAVYMAIDAEDTLWVAVDYSVAAFSSDGELLHTFGSEGTGPGQFEWPIDVAVGADGTIYAADMTTGRIQTLDADGTFHAVWSAGQLPSGGTNQPYAVGVDNQGHLYVVGTAPDGNSEANVQKFRLPE